MDAIEEVLPRCADVGWVTVIGSLVYEEADVEVVGSFGVEVEELKSESCVSFKSRGLGGRNTYMREGLYLAI